MNTEYANFLLFDMTYTLQEIVKFKHISREAISGEFALTMSCNYSTVCQIIIMQNHCIAYCKKEYKQNQTRGNYQKTEGLQQTASTKSQFKINIFHEF